MIHYFPLWKKGLGGFITIFLLASIAQAGGMKERDYQLPWCEAHGGQVEVVIDGGRIDCLTDTDAIEFDWGYKQAESIGQAMYYAEMTSRNPGVVLILKSPKGFRHLFKLLKAIRSDHRTWSVWVIWGWEVLD